MMMLMVYSSAHKDAGEDVPVLFEDIFYALPRATLQERERAWNVPGDPIMQWAISK